MDFAVEDWFCTPIAFGFLPFDIDPMMVQFCLKTKDEDKEFVQIWNSNTYNTVTKRDLVDDPIFDKVKNYLLSQVAAYVSSLGGVGPFTVSQLHGWFNVADKGDYQEVHIHSNSHVTAVVYLQAEENCGDIVFRDKYFDACPLPKIDNSKYGGSRVHYKPASKKFLIFKSNTPHMVNQNNSDVRRVSMSFNYLVS